MERYTRLSYIPFIGWMLPTAVKGNSGFAMAHARQALIMAVFFTSILLGIYTFSKLIPADLKIVRLVLVILIYIIYACYFGLCITGTWYIFKRKTVEFPVFRKYTGKLGF